MAHTFRVHFEVGTPLDFVTETAGQARDKALAERPGAIIRKIKAAIPAVDLTIVEKPVETFGEMARRIDADGAATGRGMTTLLDLPLAVLIVFSVFSALSMGVPA